MADNDVLLNSGETMADDPVFAIEHDGMRARYTVNGRDVGAELYRDILATHQAMQMSELLENLERIHNVLGDHDGVLANAIRSVRP